MRQGREGLVVLVPGSQSVAVLLLDSVLAGGHEVHALGGSLLSCILASCASLCVVVSHDNIHVEVADSSGVDYLVRDAIILAI